MNILFYKTAIPDTGVLVPPTIYRSSAVLPAGSFGHTYIFLSIHELARLEGYRPRSAGVPRVELLELLEHEFLELSVLSLMAPHPHGRAPCRPPDASCN